jgi:hypothetical protein
VIGFNRDRPVDVRGSRHCFRRATELAARGQGLPARLLPPNFAAGEDRAWRSEPARIRELSESAGREPAGPTPLGMQLSVDISLSVEPAKLSQLLSSRRELSLTRLALRWTSVARSSMAIWLSSDILNAQQRFEAGGFVNRLMTDTTSCGWTSRRMTTKAKNIARPGASRLCTAGEDGSVANACQIFANSFRDFPFFAGLCLKIGTKKNPASPYENGVSRGFPCITEFCSWCPEPESNRHALASTRF